MNVLRKPLGDVPLRAVTGSGGRAVRPRGQECLCRVPADGRLAVVRVLAPSGNSTADTEREEHGR